MQFYGGARPATGWFSGHCDHRTCPIRPPIPAKPIPDLIFEQETVLQSSFRFHQVHTPPNDPNFSLSLWGSSLDLRDSAGRKLHIFALGHPLRLHHRVCSCRDASRSQKPPSRLFLPTARMKTSSTTIVRAALSLHYPQHSACPCPESQPPDPTFQRARIFP